MAIVMAPFFVSSVLFADILPTFKLWNETIQSVYFFLESVDVNGKPILKTKTYQLINPHDSYKTNILNVKNTTNLYISEKQNPQPGDLVFLFTFTPNKNIYVKLEWGVTVPDLGGKPKSKEAKLDFKLVPQEDKTKLGVLTLKKNVTKENINRFSISLGKEEKGRENPYLELPGVTTILYAGKYTEEDKYKAKENYEKQAIKGQINDNYEAGKVTISTQVPFNQIINDANGTRINPYNILEFQTIEYMSTKIKEQTTRLKTIVDQRTNLSAEFKNKIYAILDQAEQLILQSLTSKSIEQKSYGSTVTQKETYTNPLLFLASLKPLIKNFPLPENISLKITSAQKKGEITFQANILTVNPFDIGDSMAGVDEIKDTMLKKAVINYLKTIIEAARKIKDPSNANEIIIPPFVRVTIQPTYKIQ
jgi:hypothetical protein